MTINVVKSEVTFLLDSYYPNFRDFLPYIENVQGVDYSWETTAFEADQIPMWQTKELGRLPHKTYADEFKDRGFVELLNDLCEFTKQQLSLAELEFDISPQTSWLVRYNKGGWQSMHGHGHDTINQCLYFDENPSISQEGWDKKFQVYGSFFCVVGKALRTIPPMPGRLTTMTGSILHGVYPVMHTPRRCLVIEYKVNE